MGWITQALRVLAETLGFINKRTDLKNAPDVKRRAVAQNEAAADSATAEAIRKRDLERLRNEASE